MKEKRSRDLEVADDNQEVVSAKSLKDQMTVKELRFIEHYLT
jgi:hypothetical protein